MEGKKWALFLKRTVQEVLALDLISSCLLSLFMYSVFLRFDNNKMQPEFWAGVAARPDALHALHSIAASGLDCRVGAVSLALRFVDICRS
jgi:hypothetical protein